jgi:polyphenol oxidase
VPEPTTGRTPGRVYRAAPLAQLGWVEHGFGGRDYEPAEPVALLRQMHTDVVIHADRTEFPCEGDALLSAQPGQLIGVKTADCTPILLADERHKAVAAVHAGWRGTVAEIAQSAIDAMAARWNTRGADLHVAIGPAIGPCCYEVGPEVAMQFGTLFPELDLDRRAKIDLAEANKRQLVKAGLKPDRIYMAGLCTLCTGGQFESFRRDGQKAGRMISFIGVKK